MAIGETCIHVRDSKRRQGPQICVTRATWRVLLERLGTTGSVGE
ncbi:DUF397 domain-containing protein [Streptomyces sp. NPDC102340]